MAPRLLAAGTMALACTLAGCLPEISDPGSGTLVVAPREAVTTSEDGGAVAFTVALGSKPTTDVRVTLSSTNAREGTVTPSLLTFTDQNWNAPQTITVTGVDDEVQDGDVPYQVTFAVQSADLGFGGVTPEPLEAMNVDDETAGVLVTPTAGLVTTEAGGTAAFTIQLRSAPAADVALEVSASDPTEGTVSPATVAFTPLNWKAPQEIVVTGADDAVADGEQHYTIYFSQTTSADPSYSGLTVEPVSVSNVDDESAGIAVSPASTVTTEAGGTATFTIVLHSQPTANVTVAVSTESDEASVSPGSVVFTPEDWNAPQVVTVTGRDDAVADGNQAYTVVTSAAVSDDGGYSGIDPADVSLTNTDDETAGVTIAPVSGLTTTEAGGDATFTIVLNSQPTADVTVPLSSSATTEGTVAPAAVTFRPSTWNTPQTVKVTGVDDPAADGNQPYTIVTAPAVSADPGYSAVDPPNVAVTNVDDDSAAIVVAPTSALRTTESGGAATFAVKLTSRPSAAVSVALSTSDETEGSVSPAALTFTAENWSVEQTVTVSGADDAVADGDQPYRILTAAAESDDPSYGELDADDISVTNEDDDRAGVVVEPASIVTTEAGGSATFTVRLRAEPTATVTIALTSSDPTEGLPSPGTVAFTAANWSTPQTVTVTGLDDRVDDGNQAYSIQTAPAVSGGADYNGVDGADVTATNVDDDAAAILVTPTSGLVTTEAGGTATFSVVLGAMPTAQVTIPLSSTDPAEGAVTPALLTFTAADWATAQVVTVTGRDDDAYDGDRPYEILTQAAVSADPAYSGLDASDVTVSNTDDDAAEVLDSPPTL